MTDYTSLIERLEKAEGPDRELGDDILLACGWHTTSVGYFHGPIIRWCAPDGKSYDESDRPDPTASLDAAVGLVPEDLDLEIKRARHRRDWYAALWQPSRIGQRAGDAPTAPLAILIAVMKTLKARQASEEGS